MVAAPLIHETPRTDQRLGTLDGLRGLAALAVVVYHFFVRWADPHFEPTLYAHGDWLAQFWPLQVAGRFGVLLFFLISGFVIMMTLERSKGVLDFAVRRVARLWPAMLFCATISTLLINLSGVAYVYENVSRWHVTPVEYVSSIFFIPPDMTADLFGISQSDRPRWVEGVYWTLWSEVRFYALIALVYLFSPRRHFLWAWAGVQCASTLLQAARVSGAAVPGPLDIALQPDLLCWFTLGLVAWRWRSDARLSAPALIALFAACLALLLGDVIALRGGLAIDDGAVGALLLIAMVALPFALFLANSRLLAPLSWRPLIAVGLASYPLYLLHERTGMIYLHWLNSAGVPAWISVFIAIAATIAIALAIHKFIEMPAKDWITRAFAPGAGRLQTRFAWLRF